MASVRGDKLGVSAFIRRAGQVHSTIDLAFVSTRLALRGDQS
jgi:hypothetical protein